MLGGKVKSIEDVIKKLVDVLSVVIMLIFSDLNTYQPCSPSQSPSF
jgi:hypothetical protein